MKRTASATVLLLLLFAGPAAAHDYWFEPTPSSPTVGGRVALRLFMGDGLKIEEERPFQKDRVERFTLFAPGSERDLAGEAKYGATPVARFAVASAGGHLIAMERKPSLITLDADRFTRYLEEEGLESIVAQRRDLGESGVAGREKYRRYLKAFVQAGATRDETFRRVLGHRLEILPEVDPSRLRPREPLTVRILFEGKPLPGAKVEALCREGETARVLAERSDREGRVTFRPDRPGMWLVRMVHMRRAEDRAEADWESFWATYSFGVAPPTTTEVEP